MAFEIHTEIAIAAPAAAVWEALVGTDRYAEWNPTIVWRKGRLGPGEKIRFSIRADKLTIPLNARVDRWEEGFALGWTGLAGPSRHIASGHHYFEAHPDGDGTRFVHAERFSGLPFAVIRGWVERNAQPRYEAYNAALKAFVEG